MNKIYTKDKMILPCHDYDQFFLFVCVNDSMQVLKNRLK